MFDLATLEPTGVAARGTRLASKPVRRVKLLPAKPSASKGKGSRSPRKKAPRRSVPPRGEQGSLF